MTPVTRTREMRAERRLGRVRPEPAAARVKQGESRQHKQEYLHSEGHFWPSTRLRFPVFHTFSRTPVLRNCLGGIFCQRCHGPEPVAADDGHPSRWPGVRTIVALIRYIRCIRSLDFTALIRKRPEW